MTFNTIFETIDVTIENAYTFFKSEIANQSLTLNNRSIDMGEAQPLHSNMEATFIHLVTVGEDDNKFDMYPCQNHCTQKHCSVKCQPNSPHNILYFNDGPKTVKERVQCLYRAYHIPYIPYIIDLFNNNHLENIKTWETDTKHNKNTKRFHIRYTDDSIDYQIIFEINYSHTEPFYRFITAYPLVLKSFKYRADKEHRNYLRKNI